MMPTLQRDKCTKNDYRLLFAASAEPLRWLCCTLMGDEKLSDRILDAALEQSLKGAEQVFREWMVSWARRLIIRACIAIKRPSARSLAQAAYALPAMLLGSPARSELSSLLSLPSDVLQVRLLRLDDLARFVFVLRALEGYSRRETALLLDIDDRVCEFVFLRATGALNIEAERLEMPPNNFGMPEAFSLAQAGD